MGVFVLSSLLSAPDDRSLGGRSGQSPDGVGARGEARRGKHTATTKPGTSHQQKHRENGKRPYRRPETETAKGAGRRVESQRTRRARRDDANDRRTKRSFLPWGGRQFGGRRFGGRLCVGARLTGNAKKPDKKPLLGRGLKEKIVANLNERDIIRAKPEPKANRFSG